MNKAVTGACKIETDQEKQMIALFKFILPRIVGPKENILNSIKQQDGKEILDYEAFKRLIKMIVFWKVTRLDQHKTPKNVGHWQAIRNMKRTHLFGSDEAPAEKNDSVDVDYLKLLPKYIAMINGMIKKEQGL